MNKFCKYKNIENLGLLSGLLVQSMTGLILFIVTFRIIPAARELANLLDSYPAMIGDVRFWFALFTISGWGVLGILATIIFQTTNKHLVNLLLKGKVDL